MSQRSIESFLENIRNNRIHTNKEIVYVILKKQSMNLDEMRQYTGMKHQTLTASISNLMDEGLLFQYKDRFYISEPSQIELLQAQRKLERYKKWIKAGEREGFFEQREKQLQTTIEYKCHS